MIRPIDEPRLVAGSWLSGTLMLAGKVYITIAEGSAYDLPRMTGVWTTRKKAEQWITANLNKWEFVDRELVVHEYVLDEEIDSPQYE